MAETEVRMLFSDNDEIDLIKYDRDLEFTQPVLNRSVMAAVVPSSPSGANWSSLCQQRLRR